VNIVQLNWRLCVAVFMVYCVTLSIFPGFLAGEHCVPKAQEDKRKICKRELILALIMGITR
jgi:hypothetical protein